MHLDTSRQDIFILCMALGKSSDFTTTQQKINNGSEKHLKILF